MYKHLRTICLSLVLLVATSTFADVRLTLSNGQTIVGKVLVETDDVVVIKDSEGSRYQYPRSEIVGREEVETAEVETTAQPSASHKRVGLLVELRGGWATMPSFMQGGEAGASLTIGGYVLSDRRMLLGGQIGYRHLFLSPTDGLQNKLSAPFLPIQLSFMLPLTTQPSAPFVMLSAGYAVSLNKARKGGAAADLSLGWRWLTPSEKAVMIALRASLLQTRLQQYESIDGNKYADNIGRAIIQTGASLIFEL